MKDLLSGRIADCEVIWKQCRVNNRKFDEICFDGNGLDVTEVYRQHNAKKT